jgi:RNA polymerase sigma-70 factor, ECF subfamily
MSRIKSKILFLNVKKGDISSFNQLYNCYKIKLFNFVFRLLKNKEDAEEIVQDTFVKLWQNREAIDPEKISDNYIFTIARNNVLNALRKNHPPTNSIEEKSIIEPAHNCTEEEVLFTDLSAYFQSIINKLPDKRKLIYNLSREKGYSNRKIAEELNISVKTVEVQMTKALKFLKENIKATI